MIMILLYLNQYIKHSAVSHAIVNYDRILSLFFNFFQGCDRPPTLIVEDSTSSKNNFLLFSRLIFLFL